MHSIKKTGLLALLLLAFSWGNAQNTVFKVVIPDSLQKNTTVSGRVYVFISANTEAEPMMTAPFAVRDRLIAKDLVKWKAGDTIILGAGAPLIYPSGALKLSPGKYAIQALLDVNNEERSFTFSPGNLYSTVTITDLPGYGSPVNLALSNVVKPGPPVMHSLVKEVSVKSNMLTRFYNNPVHIKASVIVPSTYGSDTSATYPAVYVIPGFGATHKDIDWVAEGMDIQNNTDKIFVVLNPECVTGHHLFVNSDNNGPRATSLVTEVIPALQQQFRIRNEAGSRFLFGHSSGAWSSIWLQLTYPDFFGGAWCTAPDPVDFSSFYNINIYKPGENVFYTRDKKPRYLESLSASDYQLTYKLLSDREWVIGQGEQYGSYEAAYSPKSKTGKPMQLWNRQTGQINTSAAKAWARYDIHKYILNNLGTLKNKAAGKIHVYVGNNDDYYLQRPLELISRSMNRLKSDIIKVDFLDGYDHFSILDKKVYDDINKEISNRLAGKNKSASTAVKPSN